MSFNDSNLGVCNFLTSVCNSLQSSHHLVILQHRCGLQRLCRSFILHRGRSSRFTLFLVPDRFVFFASNLFANDDEVKKLSTVSFFPFANVRFHKPHHHIPNICSPAADVGIFPDFKSHSACGNYS